ncbi:ATP-binding protein [Streptomyces sp. NPDC047000]|uniref:ATP-binding protein n=1 Tax=Streptomyces sp. NPDC047000 TaxID=3155474 RepID=UPI0033CAEE97
MTDFGDCDDILRDGAKPAPDLVRLLPWAGAHGQPCLLLTDGAGTASRLADRIEETQLVLGERLLSRSREVLAMRTTASAAELGSLADQLSEALGDVLRIACSRGARGGTGLPAHPALPLPRASQDALLAYAQWTLPGDDLSSAPTARRHLRDTARSWHLPPGPAGDLETVAGELVANALEHSGSRTVTVACARHPSAVVLTVTDAGTGHSPTFVSVPPPDSEHGRGLLITGVLATRWGTHRTADGLTVWAEIATGPLNAPC